MSEADFAESFWSAQEMGVAALMLYVTVISGYLVVAYLAGRDLSATQARLVSAMFVVFAFYALWGVVQYWSIGDQIRLHLESGSYGEIVTLNALDLNPAVIAGPMGIVGVIFALRFMWDVRSSGDRGEGD